MKYMIIAAMLFTIAPNAWGGSISKSVFAYECAHADAEKDGFTCSQPAKNDVKIHITKKWSDESKSKAEYYKYQLNNFIVRYQWLGGKDFEKTSDFWPKGTWQNCSYTNRGLVCVNYNEKNCTYYKNGGRSCTPGD